MVSTDIFLLSLALLIPIVGFIMTITHARKGFSRKEQRWRKRHGLLYWTLFPGITGMLVVLGTLDVLPKIFNLIGIVSLGVTTFLSWSIQQKHEEQGEL